MCWAVLGLAVARGVDGVATLSTAARRVGDAWERERRTRVCGMVAAARRNLDDAAAALGDADPRGRDGYVAAADDAGQRLDRLYEDACDLDDAELAVALHLQWHPGQPAPWPNWVPRFRTREP